MGTIAQEIQRIQGAKADLKTAIEAKGVTVPSATTIDGYATLVGQIPTGSQTNWILEKRTPPSSGTWGITLSAAEVAELVAAPYCQSLFRYISFDACTLDFAGVNAARYHYQFQSFMESSRRKSGSVGLVNVTFSTLTEIKGWERFCDSFAYSASAIKSFSCPELTEVTGIWAFYRCIASSYCETAEFPSLESITGNDAFSNFAFYNSMLTSVDFSSLETISYTGTHYTFTNAFVGCTNLVTMKVHPGALKYSEYRATPVGTATTIVNLILTDTAMDNVYLDKNTALSSDSVLGVLNHLSTDSSVTGKTCAFANLTIASSDTNYTAISTKVAALTNWTITGLTL